MITINSWPGRELWNQTFDDDVEVKIEEIRQLLDMDEDCDEVEDNLQLLDDS